VLAAPKAEPVGGVEHRRPPLDRHGDRALGVLAPDDAMALEADFLRILERPAQVVGILDPGNVATTSGTGPGSPGLLLVDAGTRMRATVVVLGREALADESIVAQAALLHGRGVRVRTLGLFYDQWFGKLPIVDLERVSLMFDIQELHAPGYARLKRAIDLAAAAVGLAALVVIAPLVWVLDRIGNRGPLLFRQTRVGKGDGRPRSRLYDVRDLVLPGVTGWAQVKFPYGASVEDALEKLPYEFFSLRHQGPMLDARIVARTVRTALRAEPVVATGSPSPVLRLGDLSLASALGDLLHQRAAGGRYLGFGELRAVVLL